MNYALKSIFEAVIRLLLLLFICSHNLTVIAASHMDKKQDEFELKTTIGKGSADIVRWQPNNDIIAVGGTRGVWFYNSSLQATSYFDTACQVYILSWSSDGSALAVGCVNGEIQIWDFNQENITISFSLALEKTYIPVAIAWNENNKLLAVSAKTIDSSEMVIQVWDTGEGILINNLSEAVTSAFSLAWHPTNDQLAIGSQESGLFIWNVLSDTVMNHLTQYKVYSLAWTPEFLLVGDATAVILLNMESNEHILPQPPSSFMAYSSISPDSTKLAMFDDVIKIWDMTSQLTLNIENAHDGRDIQSLDWSPDSKRLITSSRVDIRIWDSETGELLFINDEHSFLISGLWSPDGRSILSNEYENGIQTIRIWDSSTGTLKISREFEGYIPINRMVWCPQSQCIGINYESSSTIEIWNIVGTNLEFSVAFAESSNVLDFVWSSDNRLAIIHISSGQDNINEVSIRDGDSGLLLSTLANNSSIKAIIWHPDSTYLATVDSESSIQLWSGATYENLNTFNINSGFLQSTLDWSPDGMYLAGMVSLGVDKTQLWLLDIKAQKVSLNPENITQFRYSVNIDWSHDSNLIAVGADAGFVGIFDKDNMIEENLGSFTSDFIFVSWSPDQSHIAITGDGIIQIWELKTDR